MKNLRYSLALLALIIPAQSFAKSASDYFPVCTAPTASQGRTLAVDPTAQKEGVYRNVAAALDAAKPGDTIRLATGDYGDLTLKNRIQNGFITIEAAPGQTPKFTKLFIEGSHLRLAGLTISGFSNNGNAPAGSTTHKPLITIQNSDNIGFERNIVQSQAGQYNWQPQIAGIASPNPVSQGIYAVQSSCLSIVDNQITNVWDGIAIGGDQSDNRGQYLLVAGNIIDNFAGDGIDHYAGHIRIENNRITNGHDLCDNKCIHNDGIQGWNWNNRPGLLNTDIVIAGNQIIVQTDPNLVLPADSLQGITIFNGNWDGVHIVNNVVVTDVWHGMTVYGARNVSIVNNTVLAMNPGRRTWITYNSLKSTPPGPENSVIIRNNIAADVSVSKNDAALGTVSMDHNLKVKHLEDFEDIFVKFDKEHFQFDLHLSKRSDARGEGTAEGAPDTDIEGNPRNAKPDIGAYGYRDK